MKSLKSNSQSDEQSSIEEEPDYGQLFYEREGGIKSGFISRNLFPCEDPGQDCFDQSLSSITEERKETYESPDRIRRIQLDDQSSSIRISSLQFSVDRNSILKSSNQKYSSPKRRLNQLREHNKDIIQTINPNLMALYQFEKEEDEIQSTSQIKQSNITQKSNIIINEFKLSENLISCSQGNSEEISFQLSTSPQNDQRSIQSPQQYQEIKPFQYENSQFCLQRNQISFTKNNDEKTNSNSSFIQSSFQINDDDIELKISPPRQQTNTEFKLLKSPLKSVNQITLKKCSQFDQNKSEYKLRVGKQSKQLQGINRNLLRVSFDNIKSQNDSFLSKISSEQKDQVKTRNKFREQFIVKKSTVVYNNRQVKQKKQFYTNDTSLERLNDKSARENIYQANGINQKNTIDLSNNLKELIRRKRVGYQSKDTSVNERLKKNLQRKKCDLSQDIIRTSFEQQSKVNSINTKRNCNKIKIKKELITFNDENQENSTIDFMRIVNNKIKRKPLQQIQ